MLIDLDQFFVQQREIPQGRLYPYDLFLSHRRHDIPRSLIGRLKKAGANVVWDNNLDIRDRRVEHAVGRAIAQSRYIGLYVSGNYDDSPWCRAEYQGALKIESAYKLVRVIVILNSDVAAPRIPEALRKQPRFLASEAGITRLSKFVVEGNSLNSEDVDEGLFRRLPRDWLHPNFSSLSLDERLYILEQRANYLAMGEQEMPNKSDMEKKGDSLTILLQEPLTEWEILARALNDLVFRMGATILGINQQMDEVAAARIVSIAENFLAAYNSGLHAIDLRWAEKWFYDFLLKPILIAVRNASTAARASWVYRCLCERMKDGGYAYEVPIYLDVLSLVENGMDIGSAVSQSKVAFVQANERHKREVLRSKL